MNDTIKYICDCCGKEHESWPAITYNAPNSYSNLSAQEKEEIAVIDEDFCVIKYADGHIDRFIRVVLIQKVNDHCEDLEYGFDIAKKTSALDIGQSVVVRHGTVLAVEAFEGTNACIRRGGELGRNKDAVLVKVSKPNQDFRFDVPVIGPQTIENCAEAGIIAIGIEAGKTLLLEKEKVIQLCAKHKICIHAL